MIPIPNAETVIKKAQDDLNNANAMIGDNVKIDWESYKKWYNENVGVFSLEHIRKNDPVFKVEKSTWFNDSWGCFMVQVNHEGVWAMVPIDYIIRVTE